MQRLLRSSRPSSLLLISCCSVAHAHRVAPMLGASALRRGPLPPRLAVAARMLCSGSAPGDGSLSTNPRDNHALPCRNLAFYLIASVDAPDAAVEEHRAFLAERGMVGRVYICEDGINAQVSGRADDCAAYRSFVAAGFREPPLFKEDPVAEPSFPRLRVKLKGLVPDVGDGVDLEQRGEDVEPERWAEMLADSSLSKLVLDVRNTYEYDVGHFDGATRPQGVAHFRDSDAAAFGLPTDAKAKEETPVMMYCTGGIRCEYFSAALKQQGYKKVYKLKGGIQHYGNTMARRAEAGGGAQGPDADADADTQDSDRRVQGGGGGSSGGAQGGGVPHWKGSLFVFDRRNTVPLGDGSSEVIGRCHHCSEPTEAFINCCNVDCNKLHLVCEACLAKYEGFCMPECATAPRRRLLSLALPAGDGGGGGIGEMPKLDLATVLASTQGPAPNAPDVNRLSTVKPHGVRRAEFDADKHLLAGDGDGDGGAAVGNLPTGVGSAGVERE